VEEEEEEEEETEEKEEEEDTEKEEEEEETEEKEEEEDKEKEEEEVASSAVTVGTVNTSFEAVNLHSFTGWPRVRPWTPAPSAATTPHALEAGAERQQRGGRLDVAAQVEFESRLPYQIFKRLFPGAFNVGLIESTCAALHLTLYPYTSDPISVRFSPYIRIHLTLYPYTSWVNLGSTWGQPATPHLDAAEVPPRCEVDVAGFDAGLKRRKLTLKAQLESGSL
jgi:hypothetical protein